MKGRFSFLDSYITLSVLFLLLNLIMATPATAEGLSLGYFQGLVGAANFDEDHLTFIEPATNDPDAISTNDLSNMPYLGIAAQFPLSPTETHFGIDTSLLFGWRSDKTSIYAGNGQARIKVDSKLWLADLAIGLYAQTVLGERWRVYGAVGPMLIFGDYSDDTSEEDLQATPVTETKDSSSDSSFGAGGYAKIGMEYRVSREAFIGVAVRGIATNLGFDHAMEDDGLTGVQGFVTFTRAY